MSKQPPRAPAAAGLRRQAEARLRQRHHDPQAKAGDTKSDLDTRRLLHELQIHQVELEMQNAELQEARDRTETLLEKYTDLYDFAPAGYFTLIADGTIQQVNLIGASLLGIERSRLVGRSFELFVPTEHRPAFNAFLQQAFAGEAKQAGDFELLRKDQPPRSVNIAAQRSPDAQECRAVVADITERKHAEALLRRNEGLFSALVAQAPVGVYVVDARFRLQQVNPRALPVFHNVTPLFGRDFSEVIHVIWPKRVADQVVVRFRHTLKTGEPYQSSDFSERRRDLGVDEAYEWQIQRVTLPDGEHGVVCFFTNITERKRSEWVQRRLDMLTASNRKLEQEIVRRKLVEESLKKSERHQRRLLKESDQMQKQLRSLSHKVLHAQEEERKRISRELHDIISQTLTGINVALASLQKEAPQNAPGFDQKIARTQRLVEKSVDIVHRFAGKLRPTVLDDLGLIPALQSHMKGFMEETGVRVSLTVFSGIELLENATSTVLYRVAQEALTNVARHAQASRVDVRIQKQKGGVRMEIKDDGKGFDMGDKSRANKSGRLGMIGMKERVEMARGTLCVESAPGQPTTVRVEIPDRTSKVRSQKSEVRSQKSENDPLQLAKRLKPSTAKLIP